MKIKTVTDNVISSLNGIGYKPNDSAWPGTPALESLKDKTFFVQVNHVSSIAQSGKCWTETYEIRLIVMRLLPAVVTGNQQTSYMQVIGPDSEAIGDAIRAGIQNAGIAWWDNLPWESGQLYYDVWQSIIFSVRVEFDRIEGET